MLGVLVSMGRHRGYQVGHGCGVSVRGCGERLIVSGCPQARRRMEGILGACRFEERFGVTMGIEGYQGACVYKEMEGAGVPLGVGTWVSRGALGGGGQVRGVGVSPGDAPTLDSEGGPVLCLPAQGTGPAHVHALGPRRQLRHPAGT